jgi:hypothetical protein
MWFLSLLDAGMKKSFNYQDGYFQQDFLKIVVENIPNLADVDKVAFCKQLKQEFWELPHILGWKIPHESQQSTTGSAKVDSSGSATKARSGYNFAVPSDSAHGNFLEAINTSLNILEKHYMDRDLSRSGNSIVMISAGAGVFEVKPTLAQITKQRMLDSAFGIDFISLSRPPSHNVPLFIVSCKDDGGRDFYEMPHWIRVSFVDCKRFG